MSIKEIFGERRTQGEDHWVSVSDLMAGLMMIFMFIAIVFMIYVSKEKRQIEQIAQTYDDVKTSLYNDLLSEFEKDLPKWNAEIDKKSLSIRFKEPDVFFDPAKSDLKEKFKIILADFFPRYVAILTKEKYVNEIEEVRIEGHTSSKPLKQPKPLPDYVEMMNLSSLDRSYFDNMTLSQDRARNVLYYVMTREKVKPREKWLIQHLTANGLSFSQRIVDNNREDYEKSRRVEFRVRTKAEKRIEKILAKAD